MGSCNYSTHCSSHTFCLQRVTQAGDGAGLADIALAPTRLQKEQQLKKALEAIAARDREEIERKQREQQVMIREHQSSTRTPGSVHVLSEPKTSEHLHVLQG